ncbi:MAG: methyltransferase domain-containing protein [Candidatus Thorarchaeota archaeon]|nr:methyltransferase domain-containing protein [Candidatus Thorarchaeota archaeon]
MAVAFMASLEQSPETYEQEFDDVLEGRSRRIRERILELVKPGMKVLDLGCGPGQFAIEASKKGASVIGVDSNMGMITFAKTSASTLEKAPDFVCSDVLAIHDELQVEDIEASPSLIPDHKFDLIVSTFLLSELKPVQRDLLLRNMRKMLSDEGAFVIAAETLPESSSDRKTFWKNRGLVEKEARVRLAPPIVSLEDLIQKAGFVIKESERYGPEIVYLTGTKSLIEPPNEYQSRVRPIFGGVARTRIWYCHITGGWRGISITPGLYRAGTPNSESPVLVTANYELTYYTVMRALAKDSIDAWVLVCDTDGINVWCAARGTHFNSDDVVNMVRLTGLTDIVNHRELILPQLSAAGMDPSEIRRRTGFRVRYGPVRVYDLSEWFELGKPRPKPRGMATVTFNLRERMEQTVAHVPFLFAVLLGKPLVAILGMIALINLLASMFPIALAATYPTSLQILSLIGEFVFALAANSLVLGLLFPILPSKGNSFWRRGLGLSAITLPIAAIIMILMGVHWTDMTSWMIIQFVLVISLTMDWSGMTSVSDPKVIRREYPYLILTLKTGAMFLVVFNLIVIIMGW